MGVGQVLGKEAVHDPETAQLITGSLMDYAVPRADSLPALTIELIEVPSRHNPLGAKGVGEAGSTGAQPAVINAILDALAPLGGRPRQHVGNTAARLGSDRHGARRDTPGDLSCPQPQAMVGSWMDPLIQKGPSSGSGPETTRRRDRPCAN